jgi:hypothetical protein
MEPQALTCRQIRTCSIFRPDAFPRTSFDVLAIHPSSVVFSRIRKNRPHGPRTAILTYGFVAKCFWLWPQHIRENILLKGEPYTVVGVLPEYA